jgi:uncharacterized membrane protein
MPTGQKIIRLGSLIWIALVVITSAVFPYSVQAAGPSQTTPVVHAVLFYSPTCVYCHQVMENTLPPLMEKYQDRLVILQVNIYAESGRKAYQNYIAHFNIAEKERGVPAMVVGENVMIGAGQIPEQLPLLIEAGLAQGGVDWPDLDGIQEAIADGAAFYFTTGSESNKPTEPEVEIMPISEESLQTEEREEPLFIMRFRNDIPGNTVAVIVLIGMLGSVVLVGYHFIKLTHLDDLKGGLLGFAWPRWAIPALVAAGLGIAGYLTYVEINNVQAICGPIGKCNEVQSSPYATLWGVLPVGVFGLLGYFGILAAWVGWQFAPSSLRGYSALAMWGMALVGTLFSIYLTFLEPFVIGATCAWCIASAIIITLLFFASTRPALRAISLENEDLEDVKGKPRKEVKKRRTPHRTARG